MSHRLCLLPVTGNYVSKLIFKLFLNLVCGSDAGTDAMGWEQENLKI
jgi:hypothetical protein